MLVNPDDKYCPKCGCRPWFKGKCPIHDELPEVLPWMAVAEWYEEDEPPGFTDQAGVRWRFVKHPDGRQGKMRAGHP